MQNGETNQKIGIFKPSWARVEDDIVIPDKSELMTKLNLMPVSESSKEPITASESDCVVVDDDTSSIPESSLCDMLKISHVPASRACDVSKRCKSKRNQHDELSNDLALQSLGRSLLNIDVSSGLGRRIKNCLLQLQVNISHTSTVGTVKHSLEADKHSLSYESFCRTPVKNGLTGRLRNRCEEFPIKFRLKGRGSKQYCHEFKFNARDRHLFCLRFDTGLDQQSRLLKKRFSGCFVKVLQLKETDITDWKQSQAVQKDLQVENRWRKKNPRFQKPCPRTKRRSHQMKFSQKKQSDDIIAISSDSEVEEIASNEFSDDRTNIDNSESMSLLFKCHVCNVEIVHSSNDDYLISEHYRSVHSIDNIRVLREVVNGQVMLNIVSKKTPRANVNGQHVANAPHLAAGDSGLSKSLNFLVNGAKDGKDTTVMRSKVLPSNVPPHISRASRQLFAGKPSTKKIGPFEVICLD